MAGGICFSNPLETLKDSGVIWTFFVSLPCKSVLLCLGDLKKKAFVAVEREKRIFVWAKISPFSVSACSLPQFNFPLCMFNLRSLKKPYPTGKHYRTPWFWNCKVVFEVSTHFPVASLPWLQQERGQWARPFGAARGGPPVALSCRHPFGYLLPSLTKAWRSW